MSGSYFWYGLNDIYKGLSKYQFIEHIAHAELRRRYRRTVIGPFWTTLSLAIFISSMGILFSVLWHMNINEFMPYYASGFIVWTFFSTILSEGCTTYSSMEGLLTQIALPYSMCAFLLVYRNIIVFLHQFVIYIAVVLFFQVPLTVYTLEAIPGFIILVLNACWISIVLGVLCARFRDVQQVVTSVLQICMFVTPIFWPESQISNTRHGWILIMFNPFYQLVTIVRNPLLGKPVPMMCWYASILILMMGWFFTIRILGKSQNKLIYWLI